jgi:hypothetical protein
MAEVAVPSQLFDENGRHGFRILQKSAIVCSSLGSSGECRLISHALGLVFGWLAQSIRAAMMRGLRLRERILP